VAAPRAESLLEDVFFWPPKKKMVAAPTRAINDPNRQTVLHCVALSNPAPNILAERAPTVLEMLRRVNPRAFSREFRKYCWFNTEEIDVHWMLLKKSNPTKNNPTDARELEKDMPRHNEDNAKRYTHEER
jgi:hypothetical protein